VNRVSSPLGDKVHPRGTTSPLGVKVPLRCEIKNRPLAAVGLNIKFQVLSLNQGSAVAFAKLFNMYVLLFEVLRIMLK
jgi:hypothetical protein